MLQLQLLQVFLREPSSSRGYMQSHMASARDNMQCRLYGPRGLRQYQTRVKIQEAPRLAPGSQGFEVGIQIPRGLAQ